LFLHRDDVKRVPLSMYSQASSTCMSHTDSAKQRHTENHDNAIK